MHRQYKKRPLLIGLVEFRDPDLEYIHGFDMGAYARVSRKSEVGVVVQEPFHGEFYNPSCFCVWPKINQVPIRNIAIKKLTNKSLFILLFLL